MFTTAAAAGSFDLAQSDLPVRELSRVPWGQTYPGRSSMLKTVVIGTTALFLAASSLANAQSSQTSSPATTPERLTKADRNTLTDMRVDLVKAALQLTPEQEKLWPPVESAIRANADNRSARI